LFQFQAPTEGFSKRPYDICKDFEKFGADPAAEAPDEPMRRSTDMRHFGDGRFDNDLRRTGLTYGR
jgi:hypothetical protein